jgi:hypothetical protein
LLVIVPFSQVLFTKFTVAVTSTLVATDDDACKPASSTRALEPDDDDGDEDPVLLLFLLISVAFHTVSTVK